jgi:hypothetical protein
LLSLLPLRCVALALALAIAVAIAIAVALPVAAAIASTVAIAIAIAVAVLIAVAGAVIVVIAVVVAVALPFPSPLMLLLPLPLPVAITDAISVAVAVPITVAVPIPVAVAVSTPSYYGWLLCVRRRDSDIMDVVIASWIVIVVITVSPPSPAEVRRAETCEGGRGHGGNCLGVNTGPSPCCGRVGKASKRMFSWSSSLTTYLKTVFFCKNDQSYKKTKDGDCQCT